MSKLSFCPLFAGLNETETEALLSGRFSVKQYVPGELIALQNSRYDKLLLVSEGVVRGEMIDELGRTTLIEEISAPRVIAPAFLYATENRLPVQILAAVSTEITSIPRDLFTEIMQKDARVLTNYLRSMADRSRFLSEKLRLQRFGSIKDKMTHYLQETARLRQSDAFVIEHTQRELADMFGVTRPALGRCIRQMEEQGLFRSKGKFYQLERAFYIL
jgi:CRP/FNR family transcriptional regulator, dissimilatory nitrate respiration regulator